jgi:molybdate transport system regulatory protein
VQKENNMRLSARNQLNATIDSVQLGEVMATVKLIVPDGQQLTAAITRDSVEELALAAGDAVKVIIKSTEVMIGKDD